MKQIARSLLVVGLSCGLLGGCMGDMEVGESEQALAQEEEAYLAQEASSDAEEALYSEEDRDDAALERGDYSTEICGGWAGYGSACQVQCSNGGWYTAGYHPNVGYGDCTAAGRGFCAAWGMGAIGHCWN